MSVATPDQRLGLKYVGVPTTIAATTTSGSDRVGPLAAGIWEITTSAACFYRQGGSGVAATTSSNPLWTNERLELHVEKTADAYVAAITASGTATVYLVPRSS